MLFPASLPPRDAGVTVGRSPPVSSCLAFSKVMVIPSGSNMVLP